MKRHVGYALAVVLAAIAAMPSAVSAASAVPQHCAPTPYFSAQAYPGKKNVVGFGNLAKPRGKSQYAPGQLVYFTGTIYDQSCVPLKDAVVEIWHADTNGVYELPTRGDLINPYPLFAASGRAYTDSNGRFSFVTIFPGARKGAAPRVNIKVEHKRLPNFSTVMFFKNDERNAKDVLYKRLSRKGNVEADISLLDASGADDAIAADFAITLKGRDTFRHF